MLGYFLEMLLFRWKKQVCIFHPHFLSYYTPQYFTCTAPSGPPINVRLTAILARSITLSWNLPLPGDLNGVLTGYTVKVENTDSGDTNLFTTTETVYTVDTLTPYQNYNISVAASTVVGRGPFSASTSVVTPEDGKNLYEHIIPMIILRNFPYVQYQEHHNHQMFKKLQALQLNCLYHGILPLNQTGSFCPTQCTVASRKMDMLQMMNHQIQHKKYWAVQMKQ